MTKPDPLTPSALAQVPEVRDMRDRYAAVEREIGFDPGDQRLGPDGTYRFADEAFDALLLAVRDATLKAHREQLLALTPEEAVAAAAKVAYEGAWNEYERTHEFYADTRTIDAAVRAALPVLLAPEVAKREAAERERDRLGIVVTEYDRLRHHLNGHNWSSRAVLEEVEGAIRAALGGSNG